ncbi:FadR/GntR family transcriptional regulator [Celerinatantimonas sp. MCCC 1A17872]|uniref:FadR/GntR family transcriptional regulator n=1 Tax=Celerinatantimonas sp. MCCC 1A17872 TaxID=3177514 RepID=UPI0038C8B9FA
MSNQSSLFKPVQPGRASEEIALQIEAAVLCGDLKAGESLPSERELQQLFQTGRGVVREALQTLRQKGMIEVRKGAHGGTYIKQIEVAQVSESLTLFLRQNHIEPIHIIRYRESMDHAMAAQALTQASQEQRQTLVPMATKLAQLAEDEATSQQQLGELDRNLNIAFAKLSHNPVFIWMTQAMQMGFSSQDYKLYEDTQFRLLTAQNWAHTAQALANGDLQQTHAYISKHYLLLRECVQNHQELSTHHSFINPK